MPNPPSNYSWPKVGFAPVDDVLSRLQARGVDPNQIAAFVANLVGAPAPSAEGNNVPGFDFMSRVVRASSVALAGQTEAMNAAWAEARRGTFGFGSAMRAFTGIAESYFDVVVETWNGPGYIPRPVWLYFDYIQNKDGSWTPETLKAPARMDRAVSLETQPEATIFVPLGKGGPEPELYRDNGIVVQGRELIVTLDPAAVQNLDGQYVSFIFAKGRSAEAPLAIVVLRVTRLPPARPGGAGAPPVAAKPAAAKPAALVQQAAPAKARKPPRAKAKP